MLIDSIEFLLMLLYLNCIALGLCIMLIRNKQSSFVSLVNYSDHDSPYVHLPNIESICSYVYVAFHFFQQFYIARVSV